jgi:PKD repeat protein
LIRRSLTYASRVALLLAVSLIVAAPLVHAATTATFTVSPSAPVTGEAVTFTSTSQGSIRKYEWDLGTGSFVTGTATATRTFTTPGNYDVRLRVTPTNSNTTVTSTTKRVTVAANQAPTAAFTAPTDVDTAQTVTLTSTSTDPEGRPLAESWDLDGNGTFGDKTGHQVTTSFDTNGVKSVSLRVTDSGGIVRTLTKNITVHNRPPLASFGVSATAADTGSPITFTSTSSDPDGTISSYAWDFNNDGTTDATGASVSHSFAKSGTPTVTLTVTDDDGATGSASRTVTIRNRPPVAGFNMSAAEVDTGAPVQFTSTSTDPDGTISDYAWDFNNDGTTDATGATASHSFDANGTSTVRLTVTDDEGVSRSTTHDVKVNNRPPAPAFSFSPASPVDGDTVTFTSSSTDPDGTIAQQSWDLNGDGVYNDGSGPTAQRTFATPGSYTVALSVTDDDGATRTAFTTVEVAARPVPPPPPPAPPAGGSLGTGSPAVSIQSPLIAPRLLAPFPLVRILGVTTPVGARLDLLSVRTVGGTRILVLCKGKGKGCPWARKVQNARFSTARVRTMRIPGFSRRYLRAGAVVAVYVTRSGMIGKYTRFTFRKLKPPLRVDGCTAAGAARAARCPAR